MQLSLYVYPRDVVGILITSLDLKAAASSGGAMSTNGVMQSTASMPVPAHEHATCLHDVQLYSDDAYLLDSLTTFVGREITKGTRRS
jgi:hypothetical protein